MGVYGFPFVFIQWTPFTQDGIRDTDFTDIMQQSRRANSRYFFFGIAQRRGNFGRIFTYFFRMPVCIMVLGINRCR